jgi:hypothetical protein
MMNKIKELENVLFLLLTALGEALDQAIRPCVQAVEMGFRANEDFTGRTVYTGEVRRTFATKSFDAASFQLSMEEDAVGPLTISKGLEANI